MIDIGDVMIWVHDDAKTNYTTTLADGRVLTLTKQIRDKPAADEFFCPECNGAMLMRKSQYGDFWGCRQYPKCKGTRDAMGRSKEEARIEREKEKAQSDAVVDSKYRFTKG